MLLFHARVAATVVYVCPMKCGNAEYEKPGACTVCGMQLVEKGSARASAAANYRPFAQQMLARSKKVAILIGKIITSAGLSSGIDASLHVVEKLLGKGWAQRVATNLEYNWDPESKFVRAMLADKYLQSANDFIGSFERELVRHEGGTDRWETQWKIQTEKSATRIE
jgi:hypothetical protein